MDPEARARGQELRDEMKGVKVKLERRFREDDQEAKLAYVVAIFAAIDSAFRSLTSIHSGRTHHFKGVDEYREILLGKVKALEKLSKDAQSSVPRLAAALVSGSISAPILTLAGITLSLESLIPFFTILGGIGYGMYELPWKRYRRKRILTIYVDTSYRRRLYYKQYVSRSKSALVSLFKSALDIYEAVWSTPYRGGMYDNPDKIKKMVERTMSAESLETGWCDYIDDHFKKGLITPELWARCESGKGLKTCTQWPE